MFALDNRDDGNCRENAGGTPMPHVKANGLDIYYESHGPESAEPILLIMGLGAQMSRWSPELIGKLAAAGHRVIAYDNRDVGLTEKLDAAGAPDMRGDHASACATGAAAGRLHPRRHGRRRRRPAGRARDRARAHRRRLDGRDDRPAGRRRLSAEDPVADLDHVHHRQSGAAAGDAGGAGAAQHAGARPEQGPGGLPRQRRRRRQGDGRATIRSTRPRCASRR